MERQIFIYPLNDNLDKTEEEWIPCVYCKLERRLPVPATFRFVFPNKEDSCYCGKHANIVATNELNAGDSLFVDKGLASDGEPIYYIPDLALPYDVERERAINKAQWQKAHDLETRRIEMRKQEMMNFSANKSSGKAAERAEEKYAPPSKAQPKKRKEKSDNQPGFEWL
jgi:hypothetical protein